MEERSKLTVNLTSTLLKSLRLDAVEKEITYSDYVASRVRRIADSGDIGDAALLKKKYQNAGIFSGRGRPSAALLESRGAPIMKKKATFYLDEKLCKQVRRSARVLGLSVSDLVELALTAADEPSPVHRRTKLVE